MEALRGHEALRTLPFRDVVLGIDEAIDTLAVRTSVVLDTNVEKVFGLLGSKFPQHKFPPEGIEHAKKAAKEFMGSGGLSMERVDLEHIFAEWGTLSYSQVVEKMITEVFPHFLEGKAKRNPAGVFVGYYLDLANIVNPQIATFEDAVQIIAENVRKQHDRYKWFALGVYVDDAIKNKGIPGAGFDYLTDTENTERFRDTLLKFLRPKEKDHFMRGIDITFNELQIRTYGHSTN